MNFTNNIRIINNLARVCFVFNLTPNLISHRQPLVTSQSIVRSFFNMCQTVLFKLKYAFLLRLSRTFLRKRYKIKFLSFSPLHILVAFKKAFKIKKHLKNKLTCLIVEKENIFL